MAKGWTQEDDCCAVNLGVLGCMVYRGAPTPQKSVARLQKSGLAAFQNAENMDS
jgi:hypothetical protein